jgi:hypothetical protein
MPVEQSGCFARSKAVLKSPHSRRWRGYQDLSPRDVSWTAAGSEAPRRFRACDSFSFARSRPVRTKAPSPLRSAGALHDVPMTERGSHAHEASWRAGRTPRRWRGYQDLSPRDVSWTAAGSEAPRRFRACDSFSFARSRPVRTKAPSPLRFAGALHDVPMTGRGSRVREASWSACGPSPFLCGETQESLP